MNQKSNVRKRGLLSTWLLIVVVTISGASVWLVFFGGAEHDDQRDASNSRTDEASPVEAPVPEATIQEPPVSITMVESADTEKLNYCLIVNVWTRGGRAAAGAEVVCSRTDLTPSMEIAEEAVTRSTAWVDANGQAVLLLPDGGSYHLHCEHNGEMASATFTFGQSKTVVRELILQAPVELRGQTVDVAGKPVANALLSCLTESGTLVAQARSDGDGKFILTGLMSRRHVVRAEAEGFAPSLSGRVEPNQDLRLVMGKGGELVAMVTDRASGGPVQNFSFKLRGVDIGLPEHRGTTAATGMAILDGLSAGSYELVAEVGDLTLTPPVSRVDIALGRQIRLELFADTAASISGTVLDGITGAGVGGVVVRATGLDAIGPLEFKASTNSEGRYQIVGLPAGSVKVNLDSWPHRYGDENAQKRMAETVELVPGEDRTEVDFDLYSGFVLRGRVIFADGSPVAGATVEGWSVDASGSRTGNDISTLSDGDGRFELHPRSIVEGLRKVRNEDGSYHMERVVQATETLYIVGARWNSAGSPSAGPIDLQSSESQDIVLTMDAPPDASISGRVVDGSGHPADAQILARQIEGAKPRGGSQIRNSDAEGYFIFPSIAPGTYEFSLNSAGGLSNFQVYDRQVTVGPGQALEDIRLVLGAGGLTIRGRVLNAAGDPVRHYKIAAEEHEESEERTIFSTHTDENGAFVLENLPDGAYRLFSTDSGTMPWSEEVYAGEDIEIVLP